MGPADYDKNLQKKICQQYNSNACSSDTLFLLSAFLQTGTTCSCAPGFFGSKCQSACACVHGSCDSGTGQCECDAGWQGSQCDTPCASGKSEVEVFQQQHFYY